MCVVCTHTFDPSMHPSTSASYTNLISTLLYSILPFNKPKQRKLLLFIAEKKKKNKPSFDTQIKKETKNRAEQNRQGGVGCSHGRGNGEEETQIIKTISATRRKEARKSLFSPARSSSTSFPDCKAQGSGDLRISLLITIPLLPRCAGSGQRSAKGDPH